MSYGLCGIVLTDGDVTAVADYLEEHQVGWGGGAKGGTGGEAGLGEGKGGALGGAGRTATRYTYIALYRGIRYTYIELYRGIRYTYIELYRDIKYTYRVWSPYRYSSVPAYEHR